MQLGYEAGCAIPHAFDVVLECQLGQGTWRALEEEDADAYMVSMAGQMQYRVIPFSDLVDADTLQTTTRLIEPRSDFHRLAHGLATRLNPWWSAQGSSYPFSSFQRCSCTSQKGRPPETPVG